MGGRSSQAASQAASLAVTGRPCAGHADAEILMPPALRAKWQGDQPAHHYLVEGVKYGAEAT